MFLYWSELGIKKERNNVNETKKVFSFYPYGNK